MTLFHQVEVNSGREFGRKGGSVRDAHKKGREAEKGKKIHNIGWGVGHQPLGTSDLICFHLAK